ncbi:MAG TPA: hypothetical protein VK213_13505 [Bacteroidales bacterium]|nr:hypothetical protein [Bacteroidales bacterium]
MKSEKPIIQTFKAEFDKIKNAIITDCIISPIENPLKKAKMKALWDTGSSCIISRAAVKKLGLVPVRTTLHYCKGSYTVRNVYHVYVNTFTNIYIPVEAMESPFEGILDNPVMPPFIIGLDFIKKGNFTITQVESRSVMNFSLPTIEDPSTENYIEFEDDYNLDGNLTKLPVLTTEDDDIVTMEYDEIKSSLPCSCNISFPDDSQKTEVSAMWDTGATQSMISKSFYSKFHFPIVNNGYIASVNKINRISGCKIKIHISDYISYEVIAGIQDEDERQDLLIGMDVISLGRFQLTNIHGEALLSFENYKSIVNTNLHTTLKN